MLSGGIGECECPQMSLKCLQQVFVLSCFHEMRRLMLQCV